MLAAVLPLGSASSASKPHMAVLMSAELEPYQLVLQGLKQQLIAVANLDVYPMAPGATAESVVRIALKKKPDLIFTIGSSVTVEAIRQTRNIPIIASLVLNEAELNKAANATGVILEFSQEVQIDWLHKIIPDYRNVGVLYSAAEKSPNLLGLEKRAAEHGLHIIARNVDGARDLLNKLDGMENDVEVLLSTADAVIYNAQTAKPILLYSFRNKIPLVGLSDQWVEAGALYALGRDYRDIGMQCAEMAAVILQGKSPQDIKLESPRKIEVSLNLKTARHMKIELSNKLIKSASRVIE